MFAFDPGCVKTHTSARCRKYNSKTHGFHSGLQYDLACLLASHRKLFYALSGRWSFHTTKTLSGHSILHCTYPPKTQRWGTRPALLWIRAEIWVLRFRLMVKRGHRGHRGYGPQASEGEAQHGAFCWIGCIGQGNERLYC